MTKTKKRPKLKAFLLSMMLVFTFIFSNGGTKAEADGISALVVGAAYKLQNRTTGMFVDGMGYSTNGANCGQWTYSDSSNQRWVLEASGSYYKFRNAATGLYLDGMGRTSAGSVYGQWASSSSDNQKWRIEISGNYYKIVNVATGLVLDGGGNTGNGSDLKQWDNVSSTNLEWSFIPVNETYTGMRNITTMELTRDMGLGINLGNTFDACGDWIDPSSIDNYIQAWGSPLVTEAMIRGYAEAGFGVLRIPVAWSNMMSNDGTYTINPQLMQKVKQVVDWTIGNGMYAIVNLHWDNGWVNDFPSNKDEYMRKYTRIWTQISETFRDYNDYLIFESQNEELGWEQLWNRYSGNTAGKAESYALVNEINQTFVNVVRGTGGNNSVRHLLISGYNTDLHLTCDPLFVMPYDPAGRCAVSMHYYIPTTFTILEEDAPWGQARTTWGTEEDLRELYDNVQMVKSRFIDNGIPVIMGEYGCLGRNKTPEMKTYYNYTVAKALYDAHIVPILWDAPGEQYNRVTMSFEYPPMISQLMSILN